MTKRTKSRGYGPSFLSASLVRNLGIRQQSHAPLLFAAIAEETALGLSGLRHVCFLSTDNTRNVGSSGFILELPWNNFTSCPGVFFPVGDCLPCLA